MNDIIHQTQDYDKFKLLAGNRAINKSKVERLVEALEKRNLLYLNPIQINENFEVVDGQHRLAAARQANVPVFYIIAHGLSIEDAILENSHISGWQGLDYLHSWADRGNENYKILQIFSETYGLAVSTALGLLTGRAMKQEGASRKNAGNLMKAFKEGRLVLRGYQVKKAETFAEKLMLVKPYCENGIWKTPAFIRALETSLEKVSLAKFLTKIKTHGFTIKRTYTVKDYLRQFEDIVNHNAREGHRVQLYQV